MKVSIIIPTFKPKKEIKCLPSLKNFSYHELIIVRTKNVSKARNIGATKAQGDTLLFLEDDITFQTAPLKWVLRSLCNNCFVTSGPSEKGVCCGRVIAIRKKDFLNIGGFNEHLRFGGEDLDFGYRALKKGYKRIFIPQFFKHHTKPDTLKKGLTRAFFMTYLPLRYKRQYPNFIKWWKIRYVKAYWAIPIFFLVRILAFCYHFIMIATEER